MLIELFSLGVTATALRANNRLEIGVFVGVRQFQFNFE